MSKFSLSRNYSEDKGNKLRTYNKFKSNMKQEKYLNIKNFKLRSSMAQFRLSAHKLEIEKGRFISNTYIPPKERLCKECNMNECEDEKHFLLHCPLYTNLENPFSILVPQLIASLIHITMTRNFYGFSQMKI